MGRSPIERRCKKKMEEVVDHDYIEEIKRKE